MSNLKDGPQPFFTQDHRDCDTMWSRVEAAADSGDRAKSEQAFREFDAALRRHLDMEETVLFPAIEDATGMHGGGPTHVMRHEHRQMRALLDEMGTAASSGEVDRLLDGGDTLMMLIQQHNLKEEGILYPLAQRALGGPAWPVLADKLASMTAR